MNKIIAMYVAIQTRMQSVLKDKKGATMVEYALMVALIAAVAMGTVALLGGKVDGTFLKVHDKM